MNLTRRKFLSVAPAIAGTVALGALAYRQMRGTTLTFDDVRRAKNAFEANDYSPVGLTHLEGETVDVLADGPVNFDPPLDPDAIRNIVRNSDGSWTVTLDRPASYVSVGITYTAPAA